MSSVESKTPPAERPDVGDIPTRPQSPAVIRFLGCDAEMAGVNADFFTVGRSSECDLALPDALGGDPSIVLRFSRGPEGWRVSPSDNLPVLVNQEQVRGLTSLRSGDVIRFAPGGAGMQFSIVHQNATPLSSLVARYAPRLLGEQSDAGERGSASVNDSGVDGASPLRYEAGGARRRPAAAAPEEEERRRIDPAVLVAASILLAGFIAGAAFLYTAPPIGGGDTAATPDVEAVTPPFQQPPVQQPAVDPSIAQTEAPVNETPAEPRAPEPKPTAPSEPDDDPFSDL